MKTTADLERYLSKLISTAPITVTIDLIEQCMPVRPRGLERAETPHKFMQRMALKHGWEIEYRYASRTFTVSGRVLYSAPLPSTLEAQV